MGLLFIDIDHFKKINDTYGHQAGDKRAGRRRAARCTATIRAEDVLARYGGEEFAIICREIESEGARCWVSGCGPPSRTAASSTRARGDPGDGQRRRGAVRRR